MPLPGFIAANRERMLAEREAFAATCMPPSGVMDIAAPRDRAGEMLSVIAADLGTPHDVHPSGKSRGHARADGGGAATAAEEHGAGRARTGFTVEQVVAEHRAPRAGVLRPWMRDREAATPADLHEEASSTLSERIPE